MVIFIVALAPAGCGTPEAVVEPASRTAFSQASWSDVMTAGEQTGKIDAMLERVADFLDEEIDTTLSGLTALIEPLLIVFLGVVIGGIVVCMFLPIFKMSTIINKR